MEIPRLQPRIGRCMAANMQAPKRHTHTQSNKNNSNNTTDSHTKQHYATQKTPDQQGRARQTNTDILHNKEAATEP